MRYLLNFKYSGTYFHGYSIQNDKKTVEGEIEKALLNRFNKNIKIVGCSRTDSKVHSLDHYAHFDIDEDLELEKLKKYLNDFLNGEIYIKNISKVNKDFHARYNVKKKTYVYKINVGEFNPIEKDIVYQYCKELNIEFEWVKGHNGHEYNERCDTLAVKASKDKTNEKDRRDK